MRAALKNTIRPRVFFLPAIRLHLLHAAMLAFALLATPSTVAPRPRTRRGGALIDTRNRPDFSIKLPTDAPAPALAASASRKPNKAAGKSAAGSEFAIDPPPVPRFRT